MTTLTFEALWRDRGAQKGLRDLGAQADQTHGKFSKLSSSFSKQMGGFGRGVGGAVKLARTGAIALAATGVAAAALGAKMVNSAGKFDASMRLVGVTTGQSGKALKGLTALAMKMGAETSFSAQGASDAMLALAKGGLSAAQIKAGALKQTLTLATAGGLELGNAANYMVQGLSAFGLKARDAGRVSAALAGAANASTASVESMGMALSQVGAGAKTAGLSIEDTTAALAAFDNAGVKGSDAGTALKTFLQRLIPTTEKASSAMKALGLITADGSNKFFDAKGNIQSMTEVAGTLQEALKGQTREQKIAALTTIFGSDASRAAAILADQGAAGLARFVKATSDKTAADKLAQNATKGYAGAMERFKGSVETASIQFGTKLLPAATKSLNFLSGKFLPGVVELGNTMAPTFKAIGRIVTGVFKSIDTSIGGTKGTFQTFADFVSTHQADIISAFVEGAKGALGFGEGLLLASAGGLRAMAALDRASSRFISKFIDSAGAMLRAASTAFGPFGGLGPKLKAASRHFDAWAAGVKKGFEDQGKGADDAADKLEGYAAVAAAARRKLEALGLTEIVKAKQRDAMNAARIAIRDIGTAADGSQIKLKTWADRTKLGATEQRALAVRVYAALTRMEEQRRIGIKAGDSQKQLTKRWEEGREALYREFRQMGLSKEQARKLADQYGKVPKKIETKTSAPGAVQAKKDVEKFDKAIENTKGKNIDVNVSVNSQLNKLNKAIVKEYGKGGIKIALARGGPVPGYASSDTADNVDARLTPGEWVIRRPSARRYGPGAMKAVNEGRAAIHYAVGGEVRANTRARGETYNYSKLRDYASDMSADAARAMTRNLGLQATREAFAAATAAAKKARDAAAAAVDTAPGGRPGKVNVGRGWGPIQSAMRKRGARSFTTYPGHHPSMARARDVTPHNWAMANAARALSSVWYVIYRMKIASKNHGNGWRTYHPTNRRGDWRHVRHIHVARYDQGGDLPPGLTLAVNGTGRSERVTPMRRGGGAGNIVINISPVFPNYVGDRNDLKRHLVNMGRSGDLKAALQSAGVRV